MTYIELLQLYIPVFVLLEIRQNAVVEGRIQYYRGIYSLEVWYF